MRKNRNSDVVTSSHHESEEEENESLDDSGEDWKPEKVSFEFCTLPNRYNKFTYWTCC